MPTYVMEIIPSWSCSFKYTINGSCLRLRFPSLSMSLPISEHPRHSPARNLSFYLVLVFCVLPVWSIPIFSWSFVLYELRGGGISGLSWHGRALFTYALAEACQSTTQSLPLPESTSFALGPVLNTLLYSVQICRWPLSDFPRKYRGAHPSLQTYFPDWSS